MKAFVKVRKGNFPDVNYYLAWKGFCEIGYDVIKFEEEEIDNLEISKETPVFAGVGTCRKIIKKFFDWDYVGINPYPEELKDFMHRDVRRGKWSEFRKEAEEKHLFVKPVVQKQFIGDVVSSILSTIKMGTVPEDNEVYICDPVDFLSEWRVYVHDHEVIAVKQYFGKEIENYRLTPSYNTVEEMIKAYKPVAPISYGLDVGIIFKDYSDYDKRCDPRLGSYRETVLVEINDGICLGNYGLDSIHYAEMISARWIELHQTSRKTHIGNPIHGVVDIKDI